MIDIRTPNGAVTEIPLDTNINIHITNVLEQLTTHIQLQQIIDGDAKHIFRLRNIRRGIKLISTMPKINSIRDLGHCKGIGDGIRRRVAEILLTGTLQEIQDVDDEVRAVIELSKVHGIGPKNLAILYHNGIRSISALRQAIKHEQAEPLPTKIYTPSRIALRYHEDITQRIPRSLIVQVERYLRDYIPLSSTFQICGSYRRGAKTSGDIDVLLMASDSLPDLTPLIETLQLEGFLVAQLSGGHESYHGICYIGGRYCRIDFLLTSEIEYYPALLHFTGSGLFNQIIRWHANKQGYKLTNHGIIWRADSEYPNRKPIPETGFHSEKEIFDFLGINYLEPHERDL